MSKFSVTLSDDNDASKKPPDRQKWNNETEFLLSCIAMSVGLGNVWRFPFTAYENGGGAFLIPYLIVLIFVGKPLYYLELLIGQFSSYGSVKVWGIVPSFKGIGFGQALATWCVVTYYVSLMALTVFYFFASFNSTLPWSTCPVDYLNCVDHTTNLTIFNVSNSISAAEIYFVEKVLKQHPEGLDDGIFAPEWRLSLCLLFSWIILFFVLVKGVESSGKSAYFTALFPYVVLFILLGRGVTLPGAYNGAVYFITPQWKKLLEPKVWYAAVSQSFFSLGVGFGVIIVFGSYNKFDHNAYRTATIISVTDTLTSLLAGFTIFSILGHSAELMGVEIEDVVKGGGSTLAFVSYPDVLARFDVVPQVFAVLFFLMLFTLGLGSASALTGSIITVVCDEFPKFRRSLVTLATCISGFLLGLLYVTPQGTYLLDLVDYYGGTLIVYVLAFVEIVAITWIYGYSNLTRDIEFMLKRETGLYWRFCWVFFIPFLLAGVLIYKIVVHEPFKSGDFVFGPGANAFGIFLTTLAIGFVPIVFFQTFYKKFQESKSVIPALKACFVTSPSYYPKDPEIRQEYLKLINPNQKNASSGIGNNDFGTYVAGSTAEIANYF